MKILILGITGMLGHKLYQQLSTLFDVTGTTRGDFKSLEKYDIFRKSTVVPHIDAQQIAHVEKAVEIIQPDVVINCIGIVKQLQKSYDRLPTIWINALFPHQVAQICWKRNIRLIHISTDCVFSGKKGNYAENDPSDAEDLYGKTKFLGEIPEGDTLTIRTSLVGRELETSNNLVEWFLSNRGGKINGFTNAIFSGFPTIAFTHIISTIISNHPGLHGIYHIASDPINKYDLLNLIKKRMKLNIDIQPYAEFHCDRSLKGTEFQQQTGFVPPSWEDMIDEFVRDAEQYEQWR